MVVCVATFISKMRQDVLSEDGLTALASPVYFGGPCLLVLGALVAIVRWRLPRIVRLPSETRPKTVLVLSLILAVAGTVAVMCLTSGLTIAESMATCSVLNCL